MPPLYSPEPSICKGLRVFEYVSTVLIIKNIKIQRVEKVFSPRCADFETFKKVSKSCLIERAVGFLPPAHTPRYSFSSVFCGVFQQSDNIYIIEVGKSDVLNVLTHPNRCESVGVDVLIDPCRVSGLVRAAA